MEAQKIHFSDIFCPIFGINFLQFYWHSSTFNSFFGGIKSGKIGDVPDFEDFKLALFVI